MGTANIIGNAIFGLRNKSGGNYIDPAVKESLVGLWKFDQNINESPTRNIIKNTINDKGGDLELLNFGYKLNSGYGGYIEDFSLFILSNRFEYSEISNTKVTITAVLDNCTGIYHSVTEEESALYWNTFKIKVSGSTDDVYISYTTINKSIRLYNGINTVVVPNELSWHSFTASKANTSCNITLEFVPLYEGALVTDGKDDMIVSQKTVQEMLGGSKEITVVSMIHHINNNVYHTNYIRSKTRLLKNYLFEKSYGKSFIYGYTATNVGVTGTPSGNLTDVILGDEKDLYTIANNYTGIDSDSRFSIEGYINSSNGVLYELSEVAVYWTFIANKVLTTDEINQIIAYFKLDKYVTPQVIYDVKRQGLTNDTPAADWYLKDFSGNGHDMQLYNYSKTPESGINEEGGLQSDGVTDYGQYVGDLGLKDYTIAVDRAYEEALALQVPIISSAKNEGSVTPFLMEHLGSDSILSPYSFGIYVKLSELNINRFISYQSTYKYNGINITRGVVTNTGSGLTIGKFGTNNLQYAKLALWSLLLFPYSMSEFLLERQLKRYKLGTLYPDNVKSNTDMVEVRPIVKSNTDNYMRIEYRNRYGGLIQPGSYRPVGSILRISVVLNNTLDEVSSLKVNGVDIPKSNYSGKNFWIYDATVTKSPPEINITIDEYIRFENIVQPYPEIWTITQNGNKVSWGDKLKVGSEFIIQSKTPLLPELYTSTNFYYNGNVVNHSTPYIVEKQMTFACDKTWKLNTTEPHAIYSPQKLNIPNSSLKILGYVPDLTGKGNHGKLNNFAYTEDSGVAADGSIKFDGTDDHITIPTLAHGGKCVMMKVNWSNYGMLYDQRPSGGYNTFSIYTGENHPAYSARNNGSTYIDGILNTNIIPSNLAGITHNITAVNDTATDNSTTYPRLGTSFTNATFSDMSLYEFMLFPEIPSEDEIKELNDVMGIEGGYVESPNYYWDSFGKSNINKEDIDYDNLRQGTDANRQLIDKSVLGLKAIENYIKTGNGSDIVSRRLYLNNVAYNSESGYEGINHKKKFPNTDGTMVDSGWATDLTRVTFDKINDYKVRITNVSSNKALFWYVPLRTKAFYKITGVSSEKPILFGHDGNNIILVTADTDGIYEVDWSKNMSGTTYVSSCIMAGFIGDCNITIEQVAQYPNGLLLDGVEDHAVNTVIPAVTDFTVIAKREWINKDTIGNECFIHKGVINTPIGETAFMLEYEIANDTYYRSSSYGGYINIERTNRPEKIIYQTPTSYNGTAITKGSGTDTIGLTLGAVTNNYWHGVFYKLMFYTKTIDQLSINMLKNLFERDELIDVTNPIFKKEELTKIGF